MDLACARVSTTEKIQKHSVIDLHAELACYHITFPLSGCRLHEGSFLHDDRADRSACVNPAECPLICDPCSRSHIPAHMDKLPVSGPALQTSPQLAAESTTGSRSDVCHQRCLADVCFRASAPATPPPAQRTQHAQHGSTTQLYSKSAHCLSNNGHTAMPENCRSQPPEEKLLWWPVDHVTVQGSRLAVGESCYIITGQCVLCKADDDLDMVECTQCNRFTHFQCTYPKLEQPPEVSCSACVVTQQAF